jgi:3-methyladenine DNA glycosylase AlkD
MKTQRSTKREPALSEKVALVLSRLADPAKAAPMRAYMRGRFHFLGIQTPERRAAIRPIFRGLTPAGPEELLKEARKLWKMREREYHYAAADLLAHHGQILTVAELPDLLMLVTENSWWDSVDSLVKVIGAVVRREKKAGQRQMDRALRSSEMWVRRVAMLHQLNWRGETDTVRLFAYAERLAPEKDFFIRKAIGWALREHSKHDPDAVAAFLERTKGQLSPLTFREAGRRLPQRVTGKRGAGRSRRAD